MRERVFENMMANKTKAPRAAADGDGFREPDAPVRARSVGMGGRREGDGQWALLRPSGP